MLALLFLSMIPAEDTTHDACTAVIEMTTGEAPSGGDLTVSASGTYQWEFNNGSTHCDVNAEGVLRAY